MNPVRPFVRRVGTYRSNGVNGQKMVACGSGILKSMAMANSLMILPDEEKFIEKGKKVTIIFLD